MEHCPAVSILCFSSGAVLLPCECLASTAHCTWAKQARAVVVNPNEPLTGCLEAVYRNPFWSARYTPSAPAGLETIKISLCLHRSTAACGIAADDRSRDKGPGETWKHLDLPVSLLCFLPRFPGQITSSPSCFVASQASPLTRLSARCTDQSSAAAVSMADHKQRHTRWAPLSASFWGRFGKIQIPWL